MHHSLQMCVTDDHVDFLSLLTHIEPLLRSGIIQPDRARFPPVIYLLVFYMGSLCLYSGIGLILVCMSLSNFTKRMGKFCLFSVLWSKE